MAIYQDTTYSASFQITANGVPVNITGWTFAASFRVNVTDPDPALFTLTSGAGITTTDPVNGKFTLQITQAQSKLCPIGKVVFDIMRTDTGAPNRLCGGRVKVKEAVTRL